MRNCECRVNNAKLSVNPDEAQLDIATYKCTISSGVESHKAEKLIAPFSRLKPESQRRSQHQKC